MGDQAALAGPDSGIGHTPSSFSFYYQHGGAPSGLPNQGYGQLGTGLEQDPDASSPSSQHALETSSPAAKDRPFSWGLSLSPSPAGGEEPATGPRNGFGSGVVQKLDSFSEAFAGSRLASQLASPPAGFAGNCSLRQPGCVQKRGQLAGQQALAYAPPPQQQQQQAQGMQYGYLQQPVLQQTQPHAFSQPAAAHYQLRGQWSHYCGRAAQASHGLAGEQGCRTVYPAQIQGKVSAVYCSPGAAHATGGQYLFTQEPGYPQQESRREREKQEGYRTTVDQHCLQSLTGSSTIHYPRSCAVGQQTSFETEEELLPSDPGDPCSQSLYWQKEDGERTVMASYLHPAPFTPFLGPFRLAQGPPRQDSQTGRASVQTPLGPEIKQEEFSGRPQTLVYNGAPYPSHLRPDTAVLEDWFSPSTSQSSHYTPPPMLNPLRRGTGLFVNLEPPPSTGQDPLNLYHPQDCMFNEDPSLHTAPIRRPQINIGAQYQASLPELWESSGSLRGEEEEPGRAERAWHKEEEEPGRAEWAWHEEEEEPGRAEWAWHEEEAEPGRANRAWHGEEAEPDRADLLWLPWTELQDSAGEQTHVENLLNLACSSCLPGGGTNRELALHCLSRTRGDVLAALEMLLLGTPFTQRAHSLTDYHYTGSDVWTSNERRLFNKAFTTHSKNFGMIQKTVKSKRVSQCVEFYYLCRKGQEHQKKLRGTLEREGGWSGQGFKQEAGESMAFPCAQPMKIQPAVEGVEPSPPVASNFPCKQCGKMFYKIKSRNAHMKIHRQQEDWRERVGDSSIPSIPSIPSVESFLGRGAGPLALYSSLWDSREILESFDLGGPTP
ncbi:uncharacterized protein LOC121306293 [Polyodon spathula]|uniref:uncharacterized protein LOC121306293 n=1 Tax=Polyodon spathula TaxID=7913 RepID=UPI001B7DEE1C|nr:uncharacterized protein LOC121306293 [Polyodon spathula]